MSSVTVEILLATFNGEKYLSPQLDSILNQTFQDFKILVRDGGSNDSTLHIIEEYSKNFPDKIQPIPNEGCSSGPIQNFSKLIASSKAPYILLSDQDDYWLPEKIEILINSIRNIEQKSLPTTPILIHTDLIVVDEELNKIANSFWKYIGINPNRDSFGNLLIQNIVTGCTSIFNRALADLCVPIPNEAMMHDWWLGLIASSMGELHKIDTPTVLYRQHGTNTLGAQPFSWTFSYFFERVKKIFQDEAYVLTEYLQQAEGLNNQFYQKLSRANLSILETFIEIENQGFLKKRITLIQHGFTKVPLIKNLGLFINI